MSKKIRGIVRSIGAVIVGFCHLAYLAIGLIGLVICYDIARTLFGRFAAFLGIILFPMTLAVSPWIALLKWGAWKPLAVIYGGGIAVTLIFGLGNFLVEEFEEPRLEGFDYGPFRPEDQEEELEK